MATVFQTLNGQRVQTDWERTNTEMLRGIMDAVISIDKSNQRIVELLEANLRQSTKCHCHCSKR
jgi:hypothetical protein